MEKNLNIRIPIKINRLKRLLHLNLLRGLVMAHDQDHVPKVRIRIPTHAGIILTAHVQSVQAASVTVSPLASSNWALLASNWSLLSSNWALSESSNWSPKLRLARIGGSHCPHWLGGGGCEVIQRSHPPRLQPLCPPLADYEQALKWRAKNPLFISSKD